MKPVYATYASGSDHDNKDFGGHPNAEETLLGRFQDTGIAADGGRLLAAFLNDTVEPMSPNAQSAAKTIWRKYKFVKDTGTSPDVAMSAMPIIPNPRRPRTRLW